MPIFASNFTANSLSGTVRVSGGTANIRLGVAAFAFEGNKQFVLKIRKDSTQGAVIGTSSNITIVDNSSIVSITANTATVLEGNLVSFTISTANVPNNSTVYYSVFPVTANVTADDFVANTGSFTITNNVATFALQANADVSLVDETGETFKLQVRTNSTAGNVVYTTSNVAITDTYKTYNILGFTAGSSSPITNGDNVTFTFNATNVPAGTLFYYNTTGNVASFGSNTGSFALNSTSNTFVITNPQATANTFYNVVLRTDSQSGPIVTTSNTMEVTYIPPPPRYLWTWGSGSNGKLGQGNTTNTSSPTQVGALTDWLRVSASSYHMVATKNNGTLWSWGTNPYGELGLGNTTYYSSPKQIGSLTTWSKVTAAAYQSTSAIKADGSLWIWGRNGYGSLGLGNNTTLSSPVQVGALYNWSIHSLRYQHSVAIKTDGTLWTWGRNVQGGLGLGNTTNYSSPNQVGSLTTWSDVAAGYFHTMAIKTDGTLWTWGRNGEGQLGLGNTTSISSPVQVGALTTWSKVTGDSDSTAAIKTDGTLWTWGRNSYGQLGQGNTDDRSSPVQVGALTNWSRVSIGIYAISLKTDGTLWTWGRNQVGTLGLNDTTNRSSPVQVGTSTNWIEIANPTTAGTIAAAISGAPKSLTVTGVVTGTSSPIYTGTNVTFTVSVTDHTLGTLLYYSTTGNITSFTSNIGSIAINGASNTFVIVAPNSVGSYNVVVKTGSQSGTVVATSNAMVVTPPPPPQYLWVWGQHSYYQLPFGAPYTNRTSPVQVGSLSDWAIVDAGGRHSLAIKTDGTLWTWGNNDSNGRLGLGDTARRSSPTQIGALTTWSKIAATGQGHNLAIRTDGTLWAWGENFIGNLGLGDTTDRLSPVQVGALTTWSSVSSYTYVGAAIKTDGSLWIWGNAGGEAALGLGDTTNRLSPTQVGSSYDWSYVTQGGAGGLAIKTNGTLWAWGYNGNGQRGLGDTIQRSTPVQVGALTDWSSNIQLVNGSAAVAVKTDGTLWTWGSNASGQLGQGNTTNRSSPVQVGSLTNWLNVAAGGYGDFVAAIKTDGTLWTWGNNNNNQLGLSDATSRSSPTQIGALTTWLRASGGNYYMTAIKS